MSETKQVPVSGNGNRLMHVDDLGRVCEIQAENVTIGEDNFLKATVSDYSIFYAEADSSPVVDNGGSGNGGGVNIVLIVVGIVVVAALVAGAVFFVKKH